MASLSDTGERLLRVAEAVGRKAALLFHPPRWAFACFWGLWDSWKPKDGDRIISYTVIVCPSNPLAAAIHDRMPVMLEPDDWKRWLTEPNGSDLLKPSPESSLKSYPVVRAVKNQENELPA